jgi:hypothetical protein
MKRPQKITFGEMRSSGVRGLALEPVPPSKAKLTDQQKEIFEFYGYQFWP